MYMFIKNLHSLTFAIFFVIPQVEFNLEAWEKKVDKPFIFLSRSYEYFENQDKNSY